MKLLPSHLRRVTQFNSRVLPTPDILTANTNDEILSFRPPKSFTPMNTLHPPIFFQFAASFLALLFPLGSRDELSLDLITGSPTSLTFLTPSVLPTTLPVPPGPVGLLALSTVMLGLWNLTMGNATAKSASPTHMDSHVAWPLLSSSWSQAFPFHLSSSALHLPVLLLTLSSLPLSWSRRPCFPLHREDGNFQLGTHSTQWEAGSP